MFMQIMQLRKRYQLSAVTKCSIAGLIQTAAHVHEGEYKNYRQIQYMDDRHKTYRVAQKLSHYRSYQ